MRWLALGLLLQVAACAVVGARLLLLARHTRKLPELLFGVAFLVLGVVGYPLSIAARNVALAPETAGWLLAIGFAGQNVACLALYLATWRLFRPEARWAGALVFLAAGLLAASLIGQGVTVGFAGGRDDGAWYYVGLLARAGTYVWGFCESLLYTARLRRRLALGLADPVVTDRFVLWTVAMGVLCLAFGGFLACRLAGIDAASSPPVLAFNSAIGVVCALALWLAFLPPAAYTRRVRARYT